MPNVLLPAVPSVRSVGSPITGDERPITFVRSENDIFAGTWSAPPSVITTLPPAIALAASVPTYVPMSAAF
jgi:hypothetical protein